jgi:aminoglycoside phosphotransferase (APT) family kinase protein
MRHDHLEALPAPQREAAYAALANVIGSRPIEAVRPLAGGATAAAVLRVDAGGRSYVLRIEGPASPLRNPHQYVSLRLAADAGIAPKLYYCDDISRVAVIDFIAPKPLGSFPGGPHALAQALGDLLRRLQAAPVFPVFVNYPDIVARLWAHVCRTGLFAPGVLDPATERLEEIRKAHAWDRSQSVSSHNDPVPANVMFDGRRLWLIDWESAYRNDPLVDVSIVLDNLARTPELEAALLRAWLGRTPDDILGERLKLTRTLTRLYYAGVCFSASATFLRTAPDTDISTPTLPDFCDDIRSGRYKPGAAETRHAFGKMFLAAFLTGAPTPGLDGAV